MPVFVYNYPKDIKSFYMRMNDDNETVAAVDLLAPMVGETIGGSQREERLDKLEARMKELGMETEHGRGLRFCCCTVCIVERANDTATVRALNVRLYGHRTGAPLGAAAEQSCFEAVPRRPSGVAAIHPTSSQRRTGLLSVAQEERHGDSAVRVDDSQPGPHPSLVYLVGSLPAVARLGCTGCCPSADQDALGRRCHLLI